MITLKNIVLRRGTKVVLDNASATLNPGEKVGLVGRNGAGKSSLFALLNGSLQPEWQINANPVVWVPREWLTAQGHWVQDREFGLQFRAEMLNRQSELTSKLAITYRDSSKDSSRRTPNIHESLP